MTDTACEKGKHGARGKEGWGRGLIKVNEDQGDVCRRPWRIMGREGEYAGQLSERDYVSV